MRGPAGAPVAFSTVSLSREFRNHELDRARYLSWTVVLWRSGMGCQSQHGFNLARQGRLSAVSYHRTVVGVPYFVEWPSARFQSCGNGGMRGRLSAVPDMPRQRVLVVASQENVNHELRKTLRRGEQRRFRTVIAFCAVHTLEKSRSCFMSPTSARKISRNYSVIEGGYGQSEARGGSFLPMESYRFKNMMQFSRGMNYETRNFCRARVTYHNLRLVCEVNLD